MRMLTRYIFKEVFTHSLLGLAVFSFILYLRPLGRVIQIVASKQVPVRSAIALFLLPLPSIFVVTIPLAVLVGTLIGLSRMAADGEVIAVRAVGIGRGQFLRPVLIFAAGGWLLASWMSLSLSPLAFRKLHNIEARLAAAQANYQLRPRVFIEQSPNRLLYLRDIASSGGQWRGVFIADTSDHDKVKVTLAKTGRVVNEKASGEFDIHLEHGSTQEYDPNRPHQYSTISFDQTDIPLDTVGGHKPGHYSAAMMPPLTLLTVLKKAGGRRMAKVEINYRLALPVAALVLALVALPLGLITRKGGKAYGLMLSLLLVFVYYVLMAFGLSLAKQGTINPEIGLWTANVLFGVAGIVMLHQMSRAVTSLDSLQRWAGDLKYWFKKSPLGRPRKPKATRQTPLGKLSGSLFQILDFYVLTSWLFYLSVLLVAFIGVYVIFDFFQHLADIVRNHIPITTTLAYYAYLMPQIVYLLLPLCILVATLVCFGLLTKSNEIIAVKSAGISLYRIALPVLVATALLSAGMFILGNNYLPATNQQQNAILNEIKGKPAQTAYRPDRQWIFGKSDKIYNYRFFDPDQNAFADLSVYEINSSDFSLRRRIYAARAFWEPHLHEWMLWHGWVRNFSDGKVVAYKPFSVSAFKELNETPSYFKKEVKPSAQMSALELRNYIRELKQGGFDVVRLSVAFYRKFSYPLIAFVITLIAIPFSFTTGRRGTLAGIAVSIGIAIIYWSVSSLFQVMGNLGQLPPVIAAWAPDMIFGMGGIYLFTRLST